MLKLSVIFTILLCLLTYSYSENVTLEEIKVVAKRKTSVDLYSDTLFELDIQKNYKTGIFSHGLQGFSTELKLGNMPSYFFDVPLVASSLNNSVEGKVNISLLPRTLRDVTDIKPFSIHNTMKEIFSDKYFLKDILVNVRGGSIRRKDIEVYCKKEIQNVLVNIISGYESSGDYVPHTAVENKYLWGEINSDKFRYVFGFTDNNNDYFEFTSLNFKNTMKSRLFYNSLTYYFTLFDNFKNALTFDFKKYDWNSKSHFLSSNILFEDNTENDRTYNIKHTVIKKVNNNLFALESGFDKNDVEFTGYGEMNDNRLYFKGKSILNFPNKIKMKAHLGLQKQKNLKRFFPWEMEIMYDFIGLTARQDYVTIPVMYRLFESILYKPNPDLKNEKYISFGIKCVIDKPSFKLKVEHGELRRKDPISFQFDHGAGVVKPENGDKWKSYYITIYGYTVIRKIENELNIKYMKTHDNNDIEMKDDLKAFVSYKAGYNYEIMKCKNKINILFDWLDYNASGVMKAIDKNIVSNLQNTTYFENCELTFEILNIQDCDRQENYFFPQPGRRWHAAFSIYF